MFDLADGFGQIRRYVSKISQASTRQLSRMGSAVSDDGIRIMVELSAFGISAFLPLGVGQIRGHGRKIENNYQTHLSSICGPLRTTF
jgi:hypothetical protein